MSSAGHPPPYLNEREVALYGLLEARSAAGKLFSFARIENLFAIAPDAARATGAAVELRTGGRRECDHTAAPGSP